MSERLKDAAERERIRTKTDLTLFVNAGAGSGKTSALIGRVITLVMRDRIRLSQIAAVTFTEKAGAELRDRLRAEFEKQWRKNDPLRDVARDALEDLDSAAIGTLHSFAQRILTEHPIEAGLPPIVGVLDEVGSSVAFEERWAEIQSALLDDDAIARPLLVAMATGMSLKHVRSLALALGRDWDLITDQILATPAPELHLPDLDAYADSVLACAAHGVHCTDADDILLGKLRQLTEMAEMIKAAPDVESKLALLPQFTTLKFGVGRKGNWSVPIDEVRDAARAIVAAADMIVREVQDQCLRHIVTWMGRQVLDAAEARRRDGKLEFHDLLVMSRDLLRRDASVRAMLHEDYQRLLLDEFQDTDPIQIELATRICGGAAADAAQWKDIQLPPGRLFVVGDSKQSIYRFRRASIRTYLQAERHIGEPAELTTNFRSVTPLLNWVNDVFGKLITYTEHQQPDYVALDCHRRDTGAGPAVTVLGAEAHTELPSAAAAILRTREAADVAAVIRQALDERWQVHDEGTGQWRAAGADDIAVLVPARTSLPFLEDALDAAQIPYRAEASSLVYQTSQVRELLACARAVADTTDGLALVTALRSPLFGCGDDDLWRWKQAGGSFAVFSELDEADPLATGPVGAALAYLRRLHYRSRWMTPSELLTAIGTDRRMFEVAATGPRMRDVWRRLRFVIDQARAWSEASHGGLRAYLAWAAHQGQELSRVAEAVLPETDSDSVRVMTVHAAKGLEFPIVILSGMSAQPNRGNGITFLWKPEGGYSLRLKKGVETDDFESAVPLDEQMDDQEKLRLLYVATTRARDHLVVSLHRREGDKSRTAAELMAGAGAATAAGAVQFRGYEFAVSDEPISVAAPAPAYEAWLAGVENARSQSRAKPAITASGLEGTEPEVVLGAEAEGDALTAEGDAETVAGKAKGPRDLELPPWSKGRYGSAIGRAVHAVLQVVDLATGDGLDAAVAAQSVAEGVTGHEELVASLVRSALASDVVKRAAAREHWRETYVGTTRDDGTILEGYVDLIYRDEDGTLRIIDYKTDAVPTGAIGSRVAYYKPQMDAYCEALAAATGADVSATLLFLNPTGSFAESA